MIKLNNLNSEIQFKASAQNLGESGQPMQNTKKYDEYMHNLIANIREKESSKEVEKTLSDISKQSEELEEIEPVLYKHGDTYVTVLFEYYGLPFVENLKTLNKLGVESAPQYIETVNKNGTMFVVTKQKGTKNGNIEPFFMNKNKVSKEEKLKTFHELQKLTKAGYIDNGILRAGNWYVTPENTIALPVWQNLRKIQPNESQQEIIQQYYDILFK